ncbi:MAG: segregation/condensation protein A, partial [Planctomycetes bacterium]|nr:segregation/condensation protein A [Planctomycetota bacterium]
VRTKLTIASGSLEFRELFDVRLGRRNLIAYFLAVLELAKVRMIRVNQPDAYSEIRITLAEMTA